MNKLVLVTLGIVGRMFGARIFGEDLVKADGKVAEGILPYDREASQIAYETATFGLG
mgnify:CR=1 FL=1